MQHYTQQSSLLLTPPASTLLAPAGRPFVLIGVTCHHQLPIRQYNIRQILPACDWEILKWSKPTNLIYRASINKEIVPFLIALLNNGCLFGNHFPISHHFPLDWPSWVFFPFFSILPVFLSLFCCLFDFLSLSFSCTLLPGYLDLQESS